MAHVYVNRLLIDIIRPVLAAQANPKPIMMTQLPADITDYLAGGLVYARKTSGSGLHPKFSESSSVQVDCYATDEDKAEALAALIAETLYDAWWDQTVYDHGHIAGYEATTTPFDFPDPAAPSDVVRYMAEYTLLLRPPTA